MLNLILIVLAIFIIFIVLKVYFEKYDCVVAYTGGLGSGKSFRAVRISCKLLRRNRIRFYFDNLKIWFKNLFRKKNNKLEYDREIPLLYSSIPVFITQRKKPFKMFNLVKLKNPIIIENRKVQFLTKQQVEDLKVKKHDIKLYIESSVELIEDYLLLRERLNKKSVVFIDEIGSYVSQYEYNNPNAIETLDEFVRLFRHYTKGGYLVLTEQCSDFICKPIRVRINKVFNLMNFKSYFKIFYKVQIREMSTSEDIKTIETNNIEDNMQTTFGLFPFRRQYDTYCYSERYNSVPKNFEWNYYSSLKKNKLLKISKKLVVPLTSDKGVL